MHASFIHWLDTDRGDHPQTVSAGLHLISIKLSGKLIKTSPKARA